MIYDLLFSGVCCCYKAWTIRVVPLLKELFFPTLYSSWGAFLIRLITAAIYGRGISASSVSAIFPWKNLCAVGFVRAVPTLYTIYRELIFSSGLPPSMVPTFLVELNSPRIYLPTTYTNYGRGRVFPLDPPIQYTPLGIITPLVFGWDHSEWLLSSTGAIFFALWPGSSKVSGCASTFATSSSRRCSDTFVAPDEVFLPGKVFCMEKWCVLSSWRLHDIYISLVLVCGNIINFVVNTDCIGCGVLFYFIYPFQSNSISIVVKTGCVGDDVVFTSYLTSKIKVEALLF